MSYECDEKSTGYPVEHQEDFGYGCVCAGMRQV